MVGEGEIQFAEPIIHRLQSFLTGKEAAQTTIVSKSWHSAWLTRPNLDFDDSNYDYDFSAVDDFKKYAKKTIKRYEESNLKIESFKLCMDFNCYGRAELAYKLIVKALRMGATRLCLRLSNNSSFVLPNEVFGADNLVELSVSKCRIKLDDGVVIKCRRLESLSLDDVYDLTMDVVSNIVSSCPCIEKFSLLSVFHQENDQYDEWDDAYLKVEEQGRRVDAANAMAVCVDRVVDNLIPRLRCLVLSYASFEALCLGDLLSRFLFLKDFTLYFSYVNISEEGIQISNCSLERIKLVVQGVQRYGEDSKPRVKFDVPSVRKLTFEGDGVPCLSFKSTPHSREWESHVSLKCEKQHGLSAFWFSELSELLTELSHSKTHLSLHINSNAVRFDYKVSDKIIQGLRKHELENLTIDTKDLPSLSCYAFFDGLFRLCRPKLITQYYKDDPDKRRYYGSYNRMEKTNIDFLCQTLEQGINLKVSGPTQFMYGLNDLEEVNAQALDMENVQAAEWRPIPFDEHVHEHQRVRLLLKWKSN